uniref:Uncharacterized protein n=1 Tax=Lotus japonicus TaxID=34305 RepID=I3STS2_LOTJA|nr:unknown [Lotus japonicus]
MKIRDHGTNLMSLKYSCSTALLAVILLVGSKQSILERRLRPAGSRFGTIDARSLDGHLGNVDLKSGNEVTPGHVSSFGVPRILNILNNSSISESPGNRGRLFTISANMHPTDQTSTGVE